MNLSQLAENRDNNFDFLRFIAAVFVLLSHCFPISGQKTEPFSDLIGYSLGSLGVFIFFIISGFLITKSWMTQPRLHLFLKKRVLRIFPGLFAATIFCALVIGPLTTKLELIDYFGNRLTVLYALKVSMGTLPGVFSDNPLPYVVNGSLWTLPIEIILYCIIAALGIMQLLKRSSVIIPIILLIVVLGTTILIEFQQKGFIQVKSTTISNLFCIIFFLMGSAMYLYRYNIPINNYILLAFIIFFIGSFRTSYVHLISYFTLPYIVLNIAFIENSRINNFARHGDFSYGMYIYAFPIQQTLMNFWPNMNILYFFSSAVLLSTIMAFLSWHLVETPSLRYKTKSIRQKLILFKKR